MKMPYSVVQFNSFVCNNCRVESRLFFDVFGDFFDYGVVNLKCMKCNSNFDCSKSRIFEFFCLQSTHEAYKFKSDNFIALHRKNKNIKFEDI